jgi:oleate hydratase
MPYITSMFVSRKPSDRPLVIPKEATNLAFISQYCEIPDDTVFTVQYSIRAAMMAVYGLLGIDTAIPRVFHGPELVDLVIAGGRAISQLSRGRCDRNWCHDCIGSLDTSP